MISKGPIERHHKKTVHIQHYIPSPLNRMLWTDIIFNISDVKLSL